MSGDGVPVRTQGCGPRFPVSALGSLGTPGCSPGLAADSPHLPSPCPASGLPAAWAMEPALSAFVPPELVTGREPPASQHPPEVPGNLSPPFLVPRPLEGPALLSDAGAKTGTPPSSASPLFACTRAPSPGSHFPTSRLSHPLPSWPPPPWSKPSDLVTQGHLSPRASRLPGACRAGVRERAPSASTQTVVVRGLPRREVERREGGRDDRREGRNPAFSKPISASPGPHTQKQAHSRSSLSVCGVESYRLIRSQ